MKEYIFEDVINCNVRIYIKSNYFIDAYEILVLITKHPADYKCINQ